MGLPANMDTTLGAAFIGVVVAAVLHGVSCVQAWYYFTHQRDPSYLVALVVAVMVFDTVHQALISHTVYTYLVTNYGNPAILTQLTWSLLTEVIFNGLTAFLVQTFLTLRVWKLSNHNYLVTAVIYSLVLAEFGTVTAFAIKALANFTTFAQLATLQSLSVTVNALAAMGDVMIAMTLCTLLHRSRTGFHRSDTIINKLILFAVNTGVLTSLCAIASLISILLAPNTFIYITFFFIIGRLYSNSLLATLNARKMIRSAADGITTSVKGEGFSLKELSYTGSGPQSPQFVTQSGLVSPLRSKGSVLSIGSRRTVRHTTSIGGGISIKIDTRRECAVDAGANSPAEAETPTPMAGQAFIFPPPALYVNSRSPQDGGSAVSPSSPMSTHSLMRVAPFISAPTPPDKDGRRLDSPC
ncbi:hypothetical protein DL96DRAFT_637435 [Flagelloscypha sp. PMI_526]|nr:hypothetical protein DL96DRAFT_637435 [Flagelloscypha sp. PMI_526]